MPNQGNKSKGRSGIVQKKRKPTMPAIEKQDSEGKATKDSNAKKADTGSSAKEENKTAGGGND